MPTVWHPRALDDVSGHTPSVVTVGGDNYDVADDGTVALPDDTAVRELARAYDMAADALRTDDGGPCPHCDEYDGDYVEQHIAQAHPDAE